jgi:nondiscriminating aspartyl-tRNA synthetase
MVPPQSWLQQKFPFSEVFAMGGRGSRRVFVQSLPEFVQREVLLRGWVYRLRVLGKTTFLILKDCSGEVRCVAASGAIGELRLKAEDVVEIRICGT